MWKPIIGYEDLYMINEFGDILNLHTNCLMKYFITNKGYKMVVLSKNNTRKKFLVHRLVAIHFVLNPNNYPIVLHTDNNKLNTHASNLKWGTYSENNAQAIRDGLNVVPRPDNRKYFSIYNDDGIQYIGLGINDIRCISKCNESKSNFNNIIYRNRTINNGPYSGCYVSKINGLVPAIYFPNIE